MSLANELLNRRGLILLMEDQHVVSKMPENGYFGQEVQILRESVENWSKLCESLRAHVRRSSKPSIQSYSGLLTVLEEAVRTRPSPKLIRLLECHSRHSNNLLKRLLESKPSEQYFDQVTDELGTALLEDTPSDRYKSKHAAFLKKIDSEYGVEPEFVEYVNEGIFITVSPDDHEILRDASLRQFANQNKYILIKRGDPGQENIKWGFVLCPTLPGSLEEGILPDGWSGSGAPYMKKGKWYVSVLNESSEKGQYCFTSAEVIKADRRSRSR